MKSNNKDYYITINIPSQSSKVNCFTFYFPGCSKELLYSLKEKCSICYCSLFNKKVSPNTCSHLFCKDCLIKWKRIKSICP